MSTSEPERLFLEACSKAGLTVSILRGSTIGRDWQIDFSAGDREFSAGNDHRDGFAFLERKGEGFVSFEQGLSDRMWITDEEAYARSAAFLKNALNDPDFRGCQWRAV